MEATMDFTTQLEELSELRAIADRYRDARLYQALADWYQEIGWAANAESCMKRALRCQEEEDVAKQSA